MKKLVGLVGFLAVLLIVAFVSPYFIGKAVEAEYKSQLASFDGLGEIHITQKSYERGWFGSRSTLSVELLIDGQFVRIGTLVESIDHGLFISSYPFVALASVRDSFELDSAIGLPIDSPFISGSSVIAIDKSAKGSWKISANKRADQSVLWQEATISISADEKKASFDLAFPSIKIDDNLIESFEAKGTYLVEDQQLNNLAISIKKLVIDGVEIADVALASDTKLQNSKLHSTTKLKIAHIDDGYDKLKNIGFEIVAKNLDEKIVKKIQSAHLQGFDSSYLNAYILAAVIELGDAGAEFVANIDMEDSTGKMELNGLIRTNKNAHFTPIFMPSLLGKIELDVELVTPIELARKLYPRLDLHMVEVLLNNGFLLQDTDKRIRLLLGIRNSQLFLNSKELAF